MKTLFKQILAKVYFKCGTKPESKRIFQYATGVHPAAGNGTTYRGTCSARDGLPGGCFEKCHPWSWKARREVRARSPRGEPSLWTAVKRVTTRFRQLFKMTGRGWHQLCLQLHTQLCQIIPPDRTPSLSPCSSHSVPFPGRSQPSSEPTSPSNFHTQPWLEATVTPQNTGSIVWNRIHILFNTSYSTYRTCMPYK